jgi:ketosteroid isomerase-like protein
MVTVRGIQINSALTLPHIRRFDRHMKKHTSIVLFLFSFTASILAGDPRAEQALREADDQWSKAAGAHDLEKTVSFYSSDAIVLPPNGAAITTKDGVHDMWKQLIRDMQSMSWKATRVEVAKSGELGYITGTYEMAIKDETGKLINDKGKYLEVWKKQADGSWKCSADMFSSDLPATSPPAPAEKK